MKGRRRFTWILLSQNAHVVDVRDGVIMLAMAGIGPRDSFAKGGSQDVLHEALIEVFGVDLRIETMVDPGSGQPVPGSPSDHDAERLADPAPAPPETPPAVAPEVRDQARQQVRPTRRGAAPDPAAVDDRDAAVHPDDAEIEQSGESTTELLARQLGAEVIAEEERAT